MHLIFVAAYIAACGAAKLDRAYLPPASAKTAGGSPGSLQTPFAGNSFNQGLGGLPKGSYTNDFQGVVVDAASAGTRASGPGDSGLGLPRTVYGSADSKVGEAAFRNTPVAGFRQLPGSGQTHSSSHNDQGPERPQAAQERVSNTLRFDSEVGPESFNYAFETDNGIVAEENGVENNGVQAQGAYAYKGDDGQVYSVTYTADEGGYQPKGDHLPTPPPIPEEILRSLEQNAKEEAAGIVDDGSYDAQKYNAGGDYAENDNSGQYNRKVEQSGNRHSDATSSGSFISQSNVGRPNSFAPSSAHSRFHDKSASSSVSVNDGNKSKNDYLPPNQQNRPEQSTSEFNTGNTNANIQPLSSTNKHQSQSSAFASSQPSLGTQISGFQHQQLTNVKPNQASQPGFEGEDHSSLSSNIAPSTSLGSSQTNLNSHGSVSNNRPQFDSQFQSSSNQRNSQSTNGRPQFNIDAQNQLESTRAQSASSLASLDSQTSTSHLTNGSPRFNGNNRGHGTQVPTQSASSFASFNSQASSPGQISSTQFSSQPTNGRPQFNGINRGQDVQVPTQSASSFASFNSQPSTPSQTSSTHFQSQQLINGSPQINGNNDGQNVQAPTQSASSFASFNSQAFPGQIPSGATKNNIYGSQFSRQDQNKIPESAQSTAFTGFNSQPDTSSAHGVTSKFPGNTFNSQNFDSSTQYGSQGSSDNHNVVTNKPTQHQFSDGNLQPQIDKQSHSSVESKPGQLLSFSSASFNSQIPSRPNNNPQFGSFNQKSRGPFNQLQEQNHDDTRFSPSTPRPNFSQSQSQEDSYYYNQPSQPFKTPSVHGSSFSASSNAQFSNNVHGSPSTSFPLQIQDYSKQPSSASSPTQITGQNQNNYNGITQATASSFTSSLPTTATSFNVQPSNQFGMKTTSSQFNRRPQPIQSGISAFGSQTTKSQSAPENVNHISQTNSFQSESSKVPSGNENSADSSFGQSISQQYSGEIYEYNKPAQTLPAPSNSDSSSDQFGQKDQNSKSISQSNIQPQFTNKFDTQEAASHLTSFGQPVSGSAFGIQGARGSKPFGVQIPQDSCCRGSGASAQASFGSTPIQFSGNSQFNSAGTPSQVSGHQAHLSGQNLGGSVQSIKPGQFSNQKQGSGHFGSQSAAAQSFQSGQSVVGKGEDFGGPRKPPSFDAESGYHY